MISLKARLIRALLRIYTYPKRKKFASLSRSVRLPRSEYVPPENYTLTVRNYGGVRTEILSPESASGGAVLQFHGGGHTVPLNDMYRKAAERIARFCDCDVYGIDYATGNNLVYPSLHDECFAAYSEMTRSALGDGNFVAIGDSFGANLLLCTCLRAARDGIMLPRAIVCVCPFADMAASGDSYRYNCYKDPLYAMPRRYDFDENEKRIRRISPYCNGHPLDDPCMSAAYADLGGFPDMLILCGGLETSLSDAHMLYAHARAASVNVRLHVFDGMWHDFMYMFPKLKESRVAWREIYAFISSHLSKTDIR